MNRGMALVVMFVFALAACTTAPQRVGSRAKLNEKSIVIDDVKYQLKREDSTISIFLTTTISGELETLVKYDQTTRTFTAKVASDANNFAYLLFLPIAVASDVVTFGQLKSTRSREKVEGSERKQMEGAAPDGTQINGYLTLTDGESETRLLDRTVSLMVKNGKVQFPLPNKASSCVLVSFRGDILAYGQNSSLNIDERLGCENVLTREDHLWRTLRDEADEYQAYLETYPNGKYADEARRRIARLSGKRI